MNATQRAVKIIDKVLNRLRVADDAKWSEKEYLLCEDRRAITDGALRKVRKLLKGKE